MNAASDIELTAMGRTYVITLCSASVPMPVDVPFKHELVCFSVFRSRKIEEGRVRYRLHLGHFDSEERAREALRIVRRYYPAAWVAAEPDGGMGSLDDTMNTSFKILREARARVVTAHDFAPPITESSTIAANRLDTTPQRYAVQLDWSSEPIPAGSALRLAVFRHYHLYSVRATRDGAPQHGLRLGFFKNIHSAAQIALQSRGKYPGVSVIPISHREYTLAADLLLDGTAAGRPRLVDVDLDLEDR